MFRRLATNKPAPAVRVAVTTLYIIESTCVSPIGRFQEETLPLTRLIIALATTKTPTMNANPTSSETPAEKLEDTDVPVAESGFSIGCEGGVEVFTASSGAVSVEDI